MLHQKVTVIPELIIAAERESCQQIFFFFFFRSSKICHNNRGGMSITHAGKTRFNLRQTETFITPARTLGVVTKKKRQQAYCGSGSGSLMARRHACHKGGSAIACVPTGAAIRTDSLIGPRVQPPRPPRPNPWKISTPIRIP